MTFAFKPAVRERVSTLTAFSGPSGSGKTFSALAFATGLAGPNGKIAFIDTEAGRGLHYADRFAFDHGDLKPPFSPERYMEAIAAADEAGYAVVIIDSFSHEYDGEGGISEWADKLEAEGTKSPGNWRIPKKAHKRMVNRLLQCRAHLVFCLRAEEKIRIEQVEDDRGRKRSVVVPIGWQPITEKRFLYEVTVSMMMTPEHAGVPIPVKIQDQHRHCFPDGRQVSADSGRLLGEWAAGGKAPEAVGKPGEPKLFAIARQKADAGSIALRDWKMRLYERQQDALLEIDDDLADRARAADASMAVEQGELEPA